MEFVTAADAARVARSAPSLSQLAADNATFLVKEFLSDEPDNMGHREEQPL